MKVLFIDDRRHEVERLITLSSIGRSHDVWIHIFENLEECGDAVSRFAPDIILVGHGLSAYPVTGSHVIEYLRTTGVQARYIANSGGGRVLFDGDGVEIDGSVDRSPSQIAKLLAV